MAVLAAALSCVVYLVTDVVFDSVATVTLLTAATVAFLFWFWYGLPLVRRIQDPDDTPFKQG